LVALGSVWSIPFPVARAKGIKPPAGLSIWFALLGTPLLGWVMALQHILMAEGNPDYRDH